MGDPDADPTTDSILSSGEELLRQSRELLHSLNERLGDEDGAVTLEPVDDDED